MARDRSGPAHRVPGPPVPGDRPHRRQPVDRRERGCADPHQARRLRLPGPLPRRPGPHAPVRLAAARRRPHRPAARTRAGGRARPDPRRRAALRSSARGGGRVRARDDLLGACRTATSPSRTCAGRCRRRSASWRRPCRRCCTPSPERRFGDPGHPLGDNGTDGRRGAVGTVVRAAGRRRAALAVGAGGPRGSGGRPVGRAPHRARRRRRARVPRGRGHRHGARGRARAAAAGVPAAARPRRGERHRRPGRRHPRGRPGARRARRAPALARERGRRRARARGGARTRPSPRCSRRRRRSSGASRSPTDRRGALAQRGGRSRDSSTSRSACACSRAWEVYSPLRRASSSRSRSACTTARRSRR